MRITGLVISTPDVAATRAAWRRLGDVDREVIIEQGEGGLTAVVIGVEDVAGTEQLLLRRGLSGDADGFDLAGLTWRLSPGTGGEIPGDITLDHVVVRTGDADRAVADYGARLGMDLRLDRRMEEHGFRGLFFRCGSAVVEVIAPTKGADRDAFGGLAWRVVDLEATRQRLVDRGVEVSETRTGRKPGTRVATVRDPDLATPTLLLSTS